MFRGLKGSVACVAALKLAGRVALVWTSRRVCQRAYLQLQLSGPLRTAAVGRDRVHRQLTSISLVGGGGPRLLTLQP